jgi:hypothetical protein
MRRTISIAIAVAAACSATVTAQWPTHQDRGVPRDAQGRVQMEAAPPRAADGKPDLSGNWRRADRDPTPSELRGIVGDRDGQVNSAGEAPNTARGGGPGAGAASSSGNVVVEPGIQPFPTDPNGPPLATFWELGQNIAGGLPLTPWAAEIKRQRVASDSKDNPDANCMPMGLTQFHMQPQPRKIVQTPTVILIAYEANYGLRYIYLDGRALPKQGEPQPWWYGYSVGRWDGDTLVVETNNLRGAEDGPHDGWLDVRGSPYSEQATFTERFRRPQFGKLEIDVTLTDPKAYTKPVTVRINQRIIVDEEPIEFVCNENQQFRRRIKID